MYKQTQNRKFSIHKIALWVIFIGLFFVFYKNNPEFFSIAYLKGWTAEYRYLAMLIYLGILSVLGLFFIPSMPFAIAGLAVFSPMETYLINLVGIVTSSIAVYYFARFLGLDEAFHRRYPGEIKKTKKALRNKELPVITVWSMFPAVPTDLVLYVASSLRIPLWKCLAGVGIGEGTTNAFFIFSLWLFV